MDLLGTIGMQDWNWLMDRSRSCQLTILQHPVNLSTSRPPDHTWKRQPGRPRVKWTDQLRPEPRFTRRDSGDELLVVVSRKRRYGPRWLRVNYVNEWWVRLSVCLSARNHTRDLYQNVFSCCLWRPWLGPPLGWRKSQGKVAVYFGGISSHRQYIVLHSIWDPYKNGWTDWDAVWDDEWAWFEEQYVKWGCDSEGEGAIFRMKYARQAIYILVGTNHISGTAAGRVVTSIVSGAIYFGGRSVW